MVLLTQKFCGSCGCNLEDALQKRITQITRWLAEGVRQAKNHEYDDSIRILRRAADPADYRFDELAAQARVAIDKVTALRKRAAASTEKLFSKAQAAFDNDQKADAARYIQQIPEPLRTDQSKRILARSLGYLDQASVLVSELQASIKEKNWRLAGDLLHQAIDLLPDDPQYKRLGTQVGTKLYALSERFAAGCDYDRALECLGSVPPSCQNAEHESQRNRLENLLWISSQFDNEPFATANLGRLAVRFCKEAEQDESAKSLVGQLVNQVKQTAETPRDPWAPWKADRQTWCGGPGGFLAYPQSVQFLSDSKLSKVPGRFSVAIGLAAQGLGLGRVRESFVETRTRLKGFGRRKKESAWGIDVGSFGIRAVLLTRDDEGALNVQQDYHQAFDSPTCRTGIDPSAVVSDALESMVEEIDFEDLPIWVNLPSGELVTRFMRLPPLGDKQAAAMLKSEAEQRIPLDMDALRLVNWLAPYVKDSVVGRPASVSAVRKSVVEHRMEIFNEAGLKVTGMQADSLALVNFADMEFCELCSELDADDDSAKESLDELSQPTDSVLLLDAGASTTTMLIVSHEAFWFWNVDIGGEALTSALATNAKLTSADAEKQKLNPASLEDPRHQFELVEQRQNELRSRLVKMVGEAKKQNERFNITQSWCLGGACLTHGWIRRVMLP